MDMTDDQRNELACKFMLEAATQITRENSRVQAVLVATDGEALFVTPLRLNREDAFSLLVAACSSLEPKTFDNPSGEMH
jgi:hypothetical protein